MGANSEISWTDHTFNPWEGCTKVSPGCAHCYAEARDMRFTGGKHWGKGAPRRRTSAANWKQPLKWDRDAAPDFKAEHPWFGPRPRVFCASLADWLDDEVPVEWLGDLIDLISRTPNLDWLLLTKRPQNWKSRMEELVIVADCAGRFDVAQFVRKWISGTAPENVWLGTTAEDQVRADERIPVLLSIPAKVRFLSCEPLLGAIDLSARIPGGITPAAGYVPAIHWVICGGESGKDARPMHPNWARSLRDQCAAAGIAFHFKQWGEWMPLDQVIHRLGPDWSATGGAMIERGVHVHDWPDGSKGAKFGKLTAGRLLDGVEHNAFPEVRT